RGPFGPAGGIRRWAGAVPERAPARRGLGESAGRAAHGAGERGGDPGDPAHPAPGRRGTGPPRGFALRLALPRADATRAGAGRPRPGGRPSRDGGWAGVTPAGVVGGTGFEPVTPTMSR